MTEGSPHSTNGAPARSYRVLAILGQGGFGAVYRGELRAGSGFTKQVAIKLLNEDTGKVEDFKARLRDEARLLGMLRHRAIIHVEDLLNFQGRWAIVMEFVEGADLKELVELGPLPPRTAFEIATEVASALQVAHNAEDPRTGKHLGIIHRDIKPANIRITPAGEVKVLDFGIARAAFDEREAMTRSRSFGSTGYIAPERYDGNDTPAADVFALGVVILESLSGRKLGPLSVHVNKHDEVVAGRLASLQRQLGGELGGKVHDLLGRMLDYDWEERPSTAEVVATLQQLFLEAPGPWLKTWIADNLDKVEQAETDVEPMVLSNSPITAPSSSGTVDFGTHPTDPQDTSNTMAPGGDTFTLSARIPASDPRDEPAPAEADASTRRLLMLLGGLTGASLLVGGTLLLGYTMSWFQQPDAPAQDQGPAAVHQDVSTVSPAPAATAEPEPTESPEPAKVEVATPTPEPASPPTDFPEPPATSLPSTTPAPLPAQEPPATAATGTVEIQGEVQGVVLTASDGSTHIPGELAAGSYDLRVSFATGATIELPGFVVVTEGQTTTVRCNAIAQHCR